MTDATRAATRFFFNEEDEGEWCWGGYARFHDPLVPRKVGRHLVRCINAALKTPKISSRNRSDAAQCAAEILETEHLKGAGGHVKCVPSKKAAEGAQLLRLIVKETQ